MNDKNKKWLGFALVLIGVIAYRELPGYWYTLMWIPIWTGAILYGRFT